VTTTLRDYWPVLCPSLPDAWDSPGVMTRLETAAGHMAPIPRLGFEARLGGDAQQIDLQHCITNVGDEPARLRDFLVATRAAETDPNGAWERLLRFVAAWADPSSPLHAIPEVFLEYDLDSAAAPGPTPSIFFAVREQAVANAALGLLLADPWPDGMADNLARCFAAPEPAFVSYIGAMLGRTTHGVRVNVKGVRLDELEAFLRAVEWPGDAEAISGWAAWTYDVADRVTVCLDLGATVFAHLGLEAFLSLQPAYEPRWSVALDELANGGLATKENAHAWLTVPGAVVPATHGGAWPGDWIAASLLEPSTRFSTVERRLSHFKLTIGDHVTVAKAYWGAGHVWRDLAMSEAESTSRSVGTMHEALTRATAFLVAKQSHTGRWSDFYLPAGASDEWVTGFVGAALAYTGRADARAAAARGWDALMRRRSAHDGWGYNRVSPTDADSTAWALRLARSLGVADGRVDSAGRFLASHVREDGGVTTYAERGPILEYTQLPDDASMAGWQMTHACVSAAAAPLLDDTVAAYLAAAQSTLGNWESYWWWDDEYTVALAAEAAPQTAGRAVAWALTRPGCDGAVLSTDNEPSPWATAWCVRILGLGQGDAVEETRARSIAWLLAHQRDDGSWRGSARLRVPMPAHLDPTGEQKRMESIDAARVFTTAAVVAALARCAES
jgi:hypothetical protein